MYELLKTSASELARLIRCREISCTEVVQAHLERIAQVNHVLNAVVVTNEADALSEAHSADKLLAEGNVCGPLHGVPVTIKDTIDVAGIVTSSGLTGRKDFVPERDASVVSRLKQAGAIVIGKTNTPELALCDDTDNLVYGLTHNPHDLSRTPGSSSGGEAAIIAAGGSPLGLGSDSGGSVRIPAHFCGIVSLKPTLGRVPLTGHFPLNSGLQALLWQIGPMARRVEDLARALAVISGPDGHDPVATPVLLGDPLGIDPAGLRIACYCEEGRPHTPETLAALQNAARALEAAGARVIECSPPDTSRVVEWESALCYGDGAQWIRDVLESTGTTSIHPLLSKILDEAKSLKITTGLFFALMEDIDRFKREMLGFMSSYDVLLSPAAYSPAPPHEDMTGIDQRLWSYAMTHNLTGWPAVVVPAGFSNEGLPIGVQLAAKPWREDAALRAASVVEGSMTDWKPATL